jgi:hypothetical protein
VRVGGEQSEYFAITIFERSHPASVDFWDGNWLRAKVEVAAGGFRGLVKCELRAEELGEFHRQLAALQESLTGHAEFGTLESWFFLRIEGDGIGHMAIEGFVSDGQGNGNTLRFRLACDQTQTRSLLAELGKATRDYPVLGEHPT